MDDKISQLSAGDARRIYLNERAALEKRAKAAATKSNDPNLLRVTLDKFDALPSISRLRERAGVAAPAPVEVRKKRAPTSQDPALRKKAVREAARQTVRNLRNQDSIIPLSIRDAGAALIGSANDVSFGIPAAIAAPILGVDSDVAQEFADELGRRNTAVNIAGTVAGSLLTGSALAKGGVALGTRLAASAAPRTAQVGRGVQAGLKALELRKGQTLKNAGRLATVGGTAGATTEAVKQRNVLEGAAVGAGGAVALGAGAKLVSGVVSQGTRSVSRSIPKGLRESIKEAPDKIAARQAQISKDVGSNVPLIAALNDQDFKRVTDNVVARSTKTTEIAQAGAVKQINSFMDRMLKHVNRAGKDADALFTTVGDLSQLRDDTADALMQPIQNKEIDLTQIPFDDIERGMAREIGTRIRGLAPRINEALRDLSPDDLASTGLDPSDITAARRLMVQWGLGNPVNATVREMDNLRKSLNAAGKASETSNPANSLAYKNTAKSITDFMSGEIPQFKKMIDTFAAQSRTLEGFEIAQSGKRITDIKETQLKKNLRTPEGRAGLKAGELFRQREAVSVRPTSAINAARNFATGGNLTRPASLEAGAAQPGTVTENLGDAASAGLRQSSAAEVNVLDRLIDVSKVDEAAQREAGTLSSFDIIRLGALQGALPFTKIRLAVGIMQGLVGTLPTPIAKNTAENIAELLFSAKPADTRKALDALQSLGLSERAVAGLMRNALGIGAAANNLTQAAGDPGSLAPLQDTESRSDLDPSQMTDEELEAAFQAEQAQQGNTPSFDAPGSSEPDLSQLSDEELEMAFLAEQAGQGDPQNAVAPNITGLSDEELQNLFADLESDFQSKQIRR